MKTTRNDIEATDDNQACAINMTTREIRKHQYSRRIHVGGRGGVWNDEKMKKRQNPALFMLTHSRNWYSFDKTTFRSPNIKLEAEDEAKVRLEYQ